MALFVDIEKNFNGFHLKVNLNAQDETLALFGASGSGKSMTLKCIAGIEKPDKGRIILNGVTLFDSENGINLSPQQRKTGLLFQSYALFPNMTVFENIKAGASREKDRKKRTQKVHNIMKVFSITELSEKYPHELSGGEQQRVALARILVSQPEILLLDEPFSALDSHLKLKLERELINVIKKFKKTVVFVSHDRGEVYRLSDKIAIMENGCVTALDTKQSIFENPKTVQGAILTGYRNISPVTVISDGYVLANDWGIKLKISDMPDNISAIAIKNEAISYGKDANSFTCQVTDVLENPLTYLISLKPVRCNAKSTLVWEIDKPTWRRICADMLDVAAGAELIAVF